MRGYPIDPILNAIRSYACKQQGQMIVKVPQHGSGAGAPFELKTYRGATGAERGRAFAHDMHLTLEGDWPDGLERRIEEMCADGGFQFTRRWPAAEAEPETPVPAALACRQCAGRVEVHTNGVILCRSCGYRFTPRTPPAPPTAEAVLTAVLAAVREAARRELVTHRSDQSRSHGTARSFHRGAAHAYTAILDMLPSEDEPGG